MKIQLQLKIILFFSLICIFLTGISLIFSLQERVINAKDSNTVDLLILKIRELRSIVIETILYNEARTIKLWDVKLIKLDVMMAHHVYATDIENKIASKLQEEIPLLNRLYIRLLEEKSLEFKVQNPDLIKRATNALLSRSDDMVTTAIKLQKISLEKEKNIYIKIAFICLFGMLSMFLFLLSIKIIIYYNFLVPISQLQKGTEVVGNGNLSYRIFIKTNNEIGTLSKTFNWMLNEIAEQRMHLLATARMTSLGEMASSVAHEINNPLSIIVGRSEQLLRQIENEQLANKEDFKSKLIEICSTCNRIIKIIKGLKQFSKNSINDPMESVNLGKIIRNTVSLCTEKFQEHSITIYVSGFNDININCRATEISHVLLNLLNNSYDAIENLDEKWIVINTSIDYNTKIIKLSVMDSGKSIPNSIAEKMMLPFFTTKEVGKGTGLGLSISKSIIEQHKGKLLFDKSTKNTNFVIELPF